MNKNERQALSREMEDVLFSCLHTLATEKSMTLAVNQLLENVGRYYQAARAYIVEFYYETGLLSNTFEWCGQGVEPAIEMLQDLPISVVDDWIKKFKTIGEFAISSLDEDLDHSSDDYRILQDQGINSLITAPLMRDGEILGFIGVDDPERNGKDVALLRAVSEFVLAELERRRLIQELEKMSYTDFLTGVGNRNNYRKTVSQLQKNPATCLGVVSISVNGLKGINETFGQKFGDEVIFRTAQTIRANLPGQVCRIGGDEFMIFCPEVPREEFEDQVRRLRLAFQGMEFSVAIGYDWAQEDESVDTQITRAGEWMRAMKHRYYQSEISKGKTVGNAADDLLRDIQDGCFTVRYQPQVDLKTGTVTGVEALVRKLDEEGNPIPPSMFIPFYEARDVLQHLDAHVLDLVLEDLAKLKKENLRTNISVNFSKSTLQMYDFAEDFVKKCNRHGISPADVTIEVTETIADIGREQLKELLTYIRSTGLRLSLDDFGTEYSNLSILTDIEFDEVKFDKSLVDDICQSERSQIILERLIQMCRELQDIRIVAEGIEDEQQAELLTSYGCDCGQGYHFFRPMTFQQLRQLLQEGSLAGGVAQEQQKVLPSSRQRSRFTLEEVLIRLVSGGSDIFAYRVEGQRGIFSAAMAEQLGMEKKVDDLPKQALALGLIENSSAGDWLALFSAIDRGDKRGSAKVSMRTKDGEYNLYYVRFNGFADEEGKPFYATISYENVEHEAEQSRQLSQDMNSLLNATQKQFPEILTLNLTKGSYRILSYHGATALGTPKDGRIDDMINRRMDGIVEEDRAQFYDSFCTESLQQTFVVEGKPSIRQVYRRPGRDGQVYWFETVVIRQDNEFDDGVLLTAMSRDIDALKAEEVRLQEQLWLQTEELRVTTGRMRRTICIYDIPTRTLSLPREYAAANGTAPIIENYPNIQRLEQQGVLPETIKKIQQFYADIQQGKPEGKCEVPFQHPEQGAVWKRWEYALVCDRNGAPQRAVIFVEDVTELHQHELAYRRLVQAAENDRANHLLVVEADLTSNQIDRIGGQMLPDGQKYEQGSYKEFIDQMLEGRFREEERLLAAMQFDAQYLIRRYERGENQIDGQWQVDFQDGTQHWLDVAVTLTEDPYDGHLKVFVRATDVTEMKNAQLEIQHRAERDGMTGLLNRATAISRIETLMEEARPGILIHMDLDDLKGINDTFGHGEGDRAITGIAETLKQHFRETDIISRIGGDEFLVYLPGAAANQDSIAASLSALLRKLTTIAVGEGDDQRIHCSIGCSVLQDKDSFTELYRRADMALYHVKRSSKNNFAFYSPEMEKADYKFQAQRLMSLQSIKKFETSELRYLLDAISDLYQLVLGMNLSTNDYFLMDEVRDGVFAKLPPYGLMDDFVELTVQGVHPQDREGFKEKLSRNALLKSYEQGSSSVHHYFRFGSEKGWAWVEASVVFYTNESGDVCDFTLVRWAEERENG